MGITMHNSGHAWLAHVHFTNTRRPQLPFGNLQRIFFDDLQTEMSSLDPTDSLTMLSYPQFGCQPLWVPVVQQYTA